MTESARLALQASFVGLPVLTALFILPVASLPAGLSPGLPLPLPLSLAATIPAGIANNQDFCQFSVDFHYTIVIELDYENIYI